MFTQRDTQEYVHALDGVQRRTPVYGAKTLLSEFLLKAGHTLPRHTHPHEQTGYLVSGHMRLSIGTDTHDVRPGDSWCVPGGVEHGAQIIEDCVAIEVFSPVREDYLP
jgi:quercetin dioxygenase-like cupin family protein